MKNELLLICSLLVSLSVLVKCDGETKNPDIIVKSSSGGAKVCPEGYQLYMGETNLTSNVLEYKDVNSGQYECINGLNRVKIFIKFRTCDNCIELDIASAAGLMVGLVVATFVILVSVFLIAKHGQTGTTAPNKKGSDRQHLVTNEMSNDNGDYQKLRPRKNDVYDKLKK